MPTPTPEIEPEASAGAREVFDAVREHRLVSVIRASEPAWALEAARAVSTVPAPITTPGCLSATSCRMTEGASGTE